MLIIQSVLYLIKFDFRLIGVWSKLDRLSGMKLPMMKSVKIFDILRNVPFPEYNTFTQIFMEFLKLAPTLDIKVASKKNSFQA